MNDLAIGSHPSSITNTKVVTRTASRNMRPFDAQGWIGLALSGAILIAVGIELGKVGLTDAMRAAPRTPGFWFVFVAFYLLAPATDWIIFRRLWRLPTAGFGALLRKNVANQLVLGYSGEAHFYLWARRHANLAASPFGAVKDVAMLSAVAGNAATLALMAWSWPLLGDFMSGAFGRTLAWSIGTIAGSSLLLFLLRKTLFSISRRDLIFVFTTHLIRIAASLAMVALLWHLLLPSLALGWLFALATLRMMLSRLPLLPAKEVIFAGLVTLVLGRSDAVVPAVTLLASLTILAHIVVGAGSSASALLARLRQA